MFMVRGPGDWVTSRLAFAFNQISQVSNLKIPDVEIVSIKRRMARAICVVKAYKTSKVDIAAPDEVGTGFFFKRGLIVTASHVITSQSTGAAYPNLVVHPAATPGMVIKCDCVANDTHRDVAVLKPQVPIHELSRIRFGPSSRPLAVGMSVTSAGFPNYKLGDSALVLDHRVLNLLIASAVRKANLDGVLYAGMSGGPVVDEDCRLIGLTHRGTAVPGGFANQIVRLSEIESVVATVP
jgi:S1-C subfamily serine protease